jgi:tripeptidyl-peptidase-1
VFAAFLTLINDARFKANKPAVGFVNPALYKFAAASTSIPTATTTVAAANGRMVGSNPFHDITKGKNNCCAAISNPVCCPNGYTAQAGWDPVTGLGSVDFTALKAAFLAV